VDAQEGIAEVFADLEEIAQGCRFRDCTHHGEPGCAVDEATAEGIVPASRVRSWLELQDELALNEQRAMESKPANAKTRFKPISKDARRMRKLHGKLGLKDR
jgi:ribosome biogenesis GTPase